MSGHDRAVREELASGDGVVEVLTVGDRSRPAVVFHHGTPMAAAAFSALAAPATSLGLQLVSFSRPGYSTSTPRPGRSVADNAAVTEAVLDGLFVEAFVALGWSGGGPHALADGARLAGRCRAVATMAGVAPYGLDGLDWLAGMGEDSQVEFAAALAGPDELGALVDLMTPLLAATGAADLPLALASQLSPSDVATLTGEFADAVAESIRRGAAASGAGWRDDDLAFVSPWGFELAEVAVPVAVWQGNDDRMVPEAHGRFLVEHVPAALAHVVDGAGHFSICSELAAIVAELAELGGLGGA